MHLKSLTLKGFKSFASPTTLRFEPGITCVVGPNGSGKSNVVDALTWVMGEQGAKTLRGGKMEDVIFAGTSSRPPLGRAEVTVTIDNSDNALPIEYSEVSITRRMFRDGASEYEINGSSCRLMDVQELLSDSGIGREMHVIVGQGKLNEILESRPEDRRAFIEEAAGVLKHRKRKEKAVRKLDAMSANLARLTDLTTELRRQLKPLGRQAEMARRAQTIQADLRDARLRLAADDLVTPAGRVRRHQPGRTTLRREHDEMTTRLEAATVELDAHESAVAGLSERAEAAQQSWFRLSALAERVSATVRIATERAQLLDAEPEIVERAPTPRRSRPRPTRSPRTNSSCSPSWPSPASRLQAAAATELTERDASPPRPNAPTWRRSAPKPTAAKGWPGWPARWTPCAPASSPSTRPSRGCRRASTRRRPARSRPRPSSRRCRAASASSTRAKSVSTTTTTARWPRCGWPTSASPSCSPPSAAPSVRWHRCAPASTRCRSAWTARTAPPGCRETSPAQGFSARWRTWSRCGRATRRRSRRCWGRRPTPSPPRTSAPPARPSRR